jgi:hypothetical protein
MLLRKLKEFYNTIKDRDCFIQECYDSKPKFDVTFKINDFEPIFDGYFKSDDFYTGLSINTKIVLIGLTNGPSERVSDYPAFLFFRKKKKVIRKII